MFPVQLIYLEKLLSFSNLEIVHSISRVVLATASNFNLRSSKMYWFFSLSFHLINESILCLLDLHTQIVVRLTVFVPFFSFKEERK